MALIKVPKMKAHDYINAPWVNSSELIQKGLIRTRLMFDSASGRVSTGLYFSGNDEAEEGWI